MPLGQSSMSGPRIWSCGSCTILLLSLVLPREVAAMFQGSGKRDTIHRVFKVKVTDDVRISSHDAAATKEKRAGDKCPANYSLCAATLGGNCCPENYACAQSSCYATTAAVSTCAGTVGYFACPFSLQGGCCPQGVACATDGCTAPAGATNTMTCPTGYNLCPSSMSYGCCATGMGCAVSSCYSTSPSTTTITYTTTRDGSAETITTTSVSTPTSPTSGSSGTGDSAVAKFFPSTEPKATATSSSDSGSAGGLSKGAIGGIVAGAAIVLVVVLVAAFFVIRQLKRTEKTLQSQGEITSGSRTRRDTEKKSEAHVRVDPTPTEVDVMEVDPLMVNSSNGSPRRPHHQPYRGHGRSRAGSDAPSQPSLWSGPSAGMRNTPSLASEAGDRGYFELPPRTETGPAARPPVRNSMASSENSIAQFNYHNFVYAHGRQLSDASELSAGGSDEYGPQRGPESPPMAHPIELGVEGPRPELPGSDTETESNGPHGRRSRRQHRRQSTSPSMNNVVSPVSTTMVNRPRRRENSVVSALDGQNGAERAGNALGSIEESLTGTVSLHGHYGPAVTGPTSVPDMDMPMDIMPGYAPGFYGEERAGRDRSERQ